MIIAVSAFAGWFTISREEVIIFVLHTIITETGEAYGNYRNVGSFLQDQ